MDNSLELKLKRLANSVRFNIIEGVYNAACGHPGGSLSIADILTYLYFEELNVDPSRPDMPDRDRFVLSKGHTAPALYSVLAKFNAHGINLIKLESRPIPERDFEFMFYFDLESSVYSPKLAQLLAELEQECEEFTYLGSYSEVI